MPCPFPGMDPYLEGVAWMSVHSQLCIEIARQLTPQLRPHYVALTPERFVFDQDDDVAVARTNFYPDVAVISRAARQPTGAVAVAEAPLRLPTVMPLRVPHVTVRIVDVAERQLVTAIEVLSPTNKRNPGRREYLRKRRRRLLSDVHLIEIDLLREGRRVPMRKPLPDYPYYVLLGRAESRPVIDVWPLGYRDPLPIVPVPLLPGDADVALDLQAAWRSIYEAFGYELLTDYSRPPKVPMPPEDAAWAAELLKRTR